MLVMAKTCRVPMMFMTLNACCTHFADCGKKYARTSVSESICYNLSTSPADNALANSVCEWQVNVDYINTQGCFCICQV